MTREYNSDSETILGNSDIAPIFEFCPVRR